MIFQIVVFHLKIVDNEIDDDGDGFIDCDDWDCDDTSDCGISFEDCSNEIDDDGDGLIVMIGIVMIPQIVMIMLNYYHLYNLGHCHPLLLMNLRLPLVVVLLVNQFLMIQ